MNIGIDLGTTNSALAYIEEIHGELPDYPEIKVLAIPQYVAPGQIEARRTLPSFLFLGDQTYVGAYAREQGALVPTKSVHSAKSWLSNPEVDRTAKILPWDAQEGGRVLSPVDVSAAILSTIRDAWNQTHPNAPLAAQDIVLTVPASFDEEARELTVQAAREAGIEKLTLVEEPAAAFYSWIANHLAQSQKSLFDGQLVLVCDVGGGTSDFTLIRVHRDGDRIEFTRTAVGKHLLLGGDNLDLTLAWLVESKLGTQLSIRQRTALTAAMRGGQGTHAGGCESEERRDHGAGRGIVAGRRHAQDRDHARRGAGADARRLPAVLRIHDKPTEEKRSLFRELGLPYVSDPAVTKHLAAFLSANEDAKPDAVLFNGGFFIPDICQQRVADVMERWYGKRPVILENRDLDLAVAVGAAYYSYVKATGAGCWCAADFRALITSASATTKRFAWCRAAPKRARRSNSTARICIWWRTSRSRFVCTVRSRAWTIRSGNCSRAPRPRSASACAAECRDPLRQSRRATGAGEAARAFDRSGHARSLGRFENQRAPLAAAIRIAQNGATRAPAASPRRWSATKRWRKPKL